MIDPQTYESMRLRERIAVATAAAMFVAGVLLVTVVLPAEYGVDPVGTGEAFGLTAIAGAEGAAAPVAAEPVVTSAGAVQATGASPIAGTGGRPDLQWGQAPPADALNSDEPILEWNRVGADYAQPRPFRRDTRTFTVGPDEAMEFKYRLERGGGFVYSWRSTGKVQVDFHGEPEGRPRGYAEFYEQSERTDASGTFVAPGPGIHGWYWKNLSGDTITITLNTVGFFERGTEFNKDGITEHDITE